MYQKYYTEALVLGSRERGESDRVCTLYTRDFGLVRARASGVRSESSKMRYALQNYSHAEVALVRGKSGWRIGGATLVRASRGASPGAVAFARVARLVLRLVAGEEHNPYLFAALADAHAAFADAAPASVATVELVCVARVLYALGYLSVEALDLSVGTGATLFAHSAYASEHLAEAERMRGQLLTSINTAIAEAHL